MKEDSMGFVGNNMKSRAGFTLIELLVVVSIIGTLSVIGLTEFQKYRQQVYDTAARQELANFIGAAIAVDPTNVIPFNDLHPVGRHPVFTTVSVSPKIKMWVWSYDIDDFGAGFLGFACHVNGVTGYRLYVPYTTESPWNIPKNEIEEDSGYRWVCV
jgi:prepilin-type N-terminal cleavage/methylation domain-containing protein